MLKEKFIANRIADVKLAATIATANKVRDLKQAGKDVIGLTVGEPDFSTPTNIIEASYRAAKSGYTKYGAPAGMIELREAVSKHVSNFYGLDYTINQISITAGAKQAIFNAFMASLNPGDEVILTTPFWPGYPESITIFGAKIVLCETSIDDNFLVNPKNLSKVISSRTKWLVLNSPTNPSGAVYDANTLEGIAKLVIGHPTLRVMSDDVYDHLIYGNQSFLSISKFLPKEELYRLLIINSFSKTYAMTGWRIGYACSEEILINKMNFCSSQVTGNLPAFIQMACVEALTGDQSFIPKWRDSFKERRDYVLDRLSKIDGFRCLVPSGAFYLYPSVEGFLGKRYEDKTINDDNDFADFILEKALVAVIPGSGFGLSPFIRISYASSMKELVEACDRIEKACQLLK